MLKMSVLRNTPVIMNQKMIGVVQSLHLDMMQKRVCALSISCGLRGRRFIIPADVQNLANGFIIASKVYRRGQIESHHPTLFVRDSTGILVGCVTDYAISEKDMQLEAIEMRMGFLPREYRIRLWVIDFSYHPSKHEIIVPVSLGCELIDSMRRE